MLIGVADTLDARPYNGHFINGDFKSVAKSAEAFRTISEAADEVGVPQHVLRHWEDVFGHIRPMRRAGGRRYYRPIDLDLLRGVRVLLHDERYTTKGVQKIFRENGVKFVIDLGQRALSGEAIDVRSHLDGQTAAADEPVGVAAGSLQGDNAVDVDAQRLVTQTHIDLGHLIDRLENVQNTLDSAIEKLDGLAIRGDQ